MDRIVMVRQQLVGLVMVRQQLERQQLVGLVMVREQLERQQLVGQQLVWIIVVRQQLEWQQLVDCRLELAGSAGRRRQISSRNGADGLDASEGRRRGTPPPPGRC